MAANELVIDVKINGQQARGEVSQLSKDLRATVDTQKAALRDLAASGQQGTSAYQSLLASVRANRTELAAVQEKAKAAGIELSKSTTLPKPNAAPFNAVLDQIKEKASGLDGVLKNALSIFGAGALLKGTGLIFSNFQAMFEKGLAVKKTLSELEIGFRTAGVSSEKMADAMKKSGKSVDELSDKYAVSKGSINSATATFLKYGGTVDNLAQKQELIIGLARKGGIEFDAAAKMLAKATDPENEANLKRLGIVLDKNATDTERFNKIQEKLGGTLKVSAEEAKGPIGSIERLKNALGGFQGAVGGAIIDLLAPVFDVISQLATFVSKVVLPTFRSVVTGIKGMVQGFGSLAPVIGILVATLSVFVIATNAALAAQLKTFILAKADVVIQALRNAQIQAQIFWTNAATVAQAAWNAVMAANPIGLVVLAVGALVAGLVLLYKYVTPVREAFDAGFGFVAEVVDAILPALKAVGETFLTIGKVVFTYVTLPLQIVWAVLKAVVGAVVDLFASFLGGGGDASSTLEGIATASEKVVEVLGFVQAAFEGIQAVISEFVAIIGEVVTKLIKLDFSGAADTIGQAGARLGNAFKKGFNDTIDEKAFEAAKEKIAKLSEERVEIKGKISASDDLAKLNADLKASSDKLEPLRLKVESGNATVAERKAFDELGAKVAETSAKIAKIAPEAVKGQGQIVTATGKTITTFEIATDKVEALAKGQKQLYTADMKKQTEEYSKTVESLAGKLEEQRKKQAELLDAANKTSDTKQQKALLEQYEAARKKADEYGTALEDAQKKGLKQGLLTEEAFTKVLKAQGLNVEKAKEFYAEQKKQAEEAAKVEAIINRYKGGFEAAKKAASDLAAEQQNSVNDFALAQKNLQKELSAARRGEGTRTAQEIQAELATVNQQLQKANKEGFQAFLEQKRLEEEADKRSFETIEENRIAFRQRIKDLQKKNADDAIALTIAQARAETEGIANEGEKQLALLEIETQQKIGQLQAQKTEYEILADKVEKGSAAEIAAREQLRLIDGQILLTMDERARKAQEIEKKVAEEQKKKADERLARDKARLEAAIKLYQSEADAILAIDENTIRERADKLKEVTGAELALEQLTKPQEAYDNAIKAGAGYLTAIEAQQRVELKLKEEAAVKLRAIDIETNKKLALLAASSEDPRDKEYKTALANLIAARDAELNVIGITAEKRKEIEKKFGGEVAALNEKYLNDRYGYVKDFVDDVFQQLQRVPDNTALLDQLKEEEDALFASLKKREKGWAEYAAAVGKVNERRTEAERRRIDILDVTSQAFNRVAIRQLDQMSSRALKRFDEMAANGKIAYDQLAEFALTSAASQIAAGKSVGAATVDVAFAALEKLVPVFVAQIFGSFSSLGPFGPVAAIAVTSTLMGLVSLARSAATSGFKEGGYTGNGANTDVAGVVHRNEFVSTEAVTNRHRALLEFMHRGGDPALFYASYNNTSTVDNAAVVGEIRALRKEMAHRGQPTRTHVTVPVTTNFDRRAIERGVIRAQHQWASRF